MMTQSNQTLLVQGSCSKTPPALAHLILPAALTERCHTTPLPNAGTGTHSSCVTGREAVVFALAHGVYMLRLI